MPLLVVLFLVSLNFSWFFMCTLLLSVSRKEKLSSSSCFVPAILVFLWFAYPPTISAMSESCPKQSADADPKTSLSPEWEMGMTFADNRFPFPNRIIYAAPIKVKLSSDCWQSREDVSIWDFIFVCLIFQCDREKDIEHTSHSAHWKGLSMRFIKSCDSLWVLVCVWWHKNEIRLCGSIDLIESRIELALCKLFTSHSHRVIIHCILSHSHSKMALPFAW